MCLFKPTSVFEKGGKKVRRESPYWAAQFRGPGGKVISISTKLAEKTKARKLESVWVRAAEQGRNGHLTDDDATRILVECSRICKGDSLKQSKSFIDTCLQASTGCGLNVVTVETYFREWLETKADLGNNASSTLAKYRPVLARFIQFLPENRRKAPLSSITTGDCNEFSRAERARGLSNGSANGSIKILRLVFNSARKEGVINRSPAEAAGLAQERPDKRQPFTIPQIRSILSVCDEEWRGMVMVGYLAGVRLGDAARLTWKNVKLETKLLEFVPQKTERRKQEPTIVDLHPDLVAYFSSLQPGTPLAPLFPRLSRQSVNCLSSNFRTLMNKAGVVSPTGVEKSGSGRQMNLQSFHSLRHSYCTELHNAGVPMEIRKSLAGHSSDAMAENYTDISRALTAAAIARLPSIAA
jgi:integrase